MLKRIIPINLILGCLLTAPSFAYSTMEDVTLTEAQISHVILVGNSLETKCAQNALAKSTNAKVWDFAEKMVVDHTAMLKSAKTLFARLALPAQESELSREAEAKAKVSEEALAKLEGQAFDRAFADLQIKEHEHCIEMINTVLIPSAQNADLKAFLQDALPKVQAHLEQARVLRSQI